MTYRFNEFSLRIGYRHPDKGSWPRVSTPGFYLDAGFYNEGAAYDIIKSKPLTETEMDAIGRTLVNTLGLPGELSGAMTRIGREANNYQLERLQNLKEARQRLDAQIAELERRT